MMGRTPPRGPGVPSQSEVPRGRGRRRGADTTSGVRVMYGFVWGMVARTGLNCVLLVGRSSYEEWVKRPRIGTHETPYYRSYTSVKARPGMSDSVAVCPFGW